MKLERLHDMQHIYLQPNASFLLFFSFFFPLYQIKFVQFFSCRRYTKFYGTSERAAVHLAHDALTRMFLI